MDLHVHFTKCSGFKVSEYLLYSLYQDLCSCLVIVFLSAELFGLADDTEMAKSKKHLTFDGLMSQHLKSLFHLAFSDILGLKWIC